MNSLICSVAGMAVIIKKAHTKSQLRSLSIIGAIVRVSSPYQVTL